MAGNTKDGYEWHIRKSRSIMDEPEDGELIVIKVDYGHWVAYDVVRMRGTELYSTSDDYLYDISEVDAWKYLDLRGLR